MKQALLATIGFSFFYGLQIVLQKLFLKSAIQPLHLNFLTSLSSFIILTLYFWLFNKKVFVFKMDRKVSLWYFIAAMLWIIAELLSIFGLKISSSVNFSILSRLTIIFTYLIAIIFFKEVYKTNKIIAVFLAFFGALAVVFNYKTNLKINYGDIFFILFALGNSVSGLFRQKITKHITSFQLTYLMYLLAVIVLGFITIVFFPIKEIKIWNFIIFNSILSLAGFNLVNYAIAKGGASFFAVASSILPFVTAIFSFLILGQLPLINQIVGGLLIIFSIFLFQKKYANY